MFHNEVDLPIYAYFTVTSALAIIANPDLQLGGYHSPEIVAAFAEYFGGEEDSDSDSDFPLSDGDSEWNLCLKSL